MKKFEFKYFVLCDQNSGGLSFLTIKAENESKAKKEFNKLMKERKFIKIQSINEV